MSGRKLQRLIALAREHDPSLYAWLAPAVAEYQSGENLERALGLCGSRAVRERDEALCAAAEAMDPKGQLSTWARAGKLAARLPQFEAVVLPRYTDPEADTLGVNHHLLRAYRTRQRIPRTQRALADVLKNSSADFRSAA